MIDLAPCALIASVGLDRRSQTDAPFSELVISFAIAMLRAHTSGTSRGSIRHWRQRVGGYLTGRTVGIVGCGHIGKDLVPLLRAFEMSHTRQ